MADPSVSTLMQDDARSSIAVLHGIQRMRNQLSAFQFVQAPARQNKLIIEGVQVSIYADLLAIGERAGVGLIGAAVLRMTQSDTDSDIAVQRRREMGTYVATLARAHTEANLAGNRTTTNRFCMSIDVQHGEVFVAPNSSTRRMSDLTNACRFIAAIWPTA